MLLEDEDWDDEDHEEEDEDGTEHSGTEHSGTEHSEDHEEDEHEDVLTSFDEDPCYEDSRPEMMSSKSLYAASSHLALWMLAFGSLSLWFSGLGF